MASSKTGAIVWSVGEDDTENSISSLVDAVMIVVGKAMVQILCEECS